MTSQVNPRREIPTKENIDACIDWIYKLGALRAAIELQVWEKIALGADTAEGLAAQQGWDLYGTRALLDMLCHLNLLITDGQRYSLTPESAYYLLPGKPTYKGELPLYELNWEGNGRLAESVRTGQRPIYYDATKSDVTSVWIADYSQRTENPEIFYAMDTKVWDSVGIHALNGLRVLDLACGPAPVSMALARQHPGVRLTWLDWDAVLQAALRVAARINIASQVTTLAGDLWSLDFGVDAFDAAYLGNVTHFFGAAENTRLFQKVYRALAPGGKIIVHSVARKEKELIPSAAIWLYAATASGAAYDFDEYRCMLQDAGFTNVEDVNHGPILAVKPVA